MNRRSFPYIVAALVALAAFAVYLPALGNGFVNWDDDVNVYENRHIRSFDLPFLRWAFTDVTVSYWQPAVWISHAADYALWGLRPAGHHLTNDLLHGLNTFLVVLLALRLIGASRSDEGFPSDRQALIAAGAAGLVFGLHPLHVESVAWVTERKDLLSTLFFLAAFLAYVRTASGRPLGQGAPLLRGRALLAPLAIFALALASKPMTVTLPAILVLADWYPLRRVRSLRDTGRSVVEKFPFFALSLLIAVVTVAAHRSEGMLRSLTDVTPAVRLVSAAKALLAYLGRIALPLGLSPYYPDPPAVNAFSASSLGAVAAVIAITALCLALARKRPVFAAVWASYLIILLPVLGFIKTVAVTQADRFTYLSSIGPFLLLGLGAAKAAELAEHRGRAVRRGLVVLAAALCIVLAAATVRQTGVWKNGVTLWTSVINRWADRAPVAYANRGTAFMLRGDRERAIEDYTKAIVLSPSDAGIYTNRANAYKALGMLDRAAEDQTRAIELQPGLSRAYLGRALVREEQGRLGPALEDMNRAVERDPHSADAYTGRGGVLARQGKRDRAREDYDRAIALDGTAYIAYNDRGMLLLEQGETGRAIEDFSRALKLSPSFVQARVNRGLAFSRAGRTGMAIKDLTAAIAADPAFAPAYTNRGLLHQREGRPEQALEDLNRAIELDPESAEAYTDRGLVFEDLGKYDRALSDYDRAVALRPRDPEGYNDRGIALRKLGRFADALRDHGRALALDRNFGRAYLDRAETYRAMGRMEQAKQDLRSACGLGIGEACAALQDGP